MLFEQADRITAVGSGVDDAVRRIETSYTQFHAIDKVTSYDADTGGSVVLRTIDLACERMHTVFRDETTEIGGAVT